MLALIRAQLSFRRGRLVATLAAVAVAVASFALLASAARGSQVRVNGTVQANFRPMYDILVRPPMDGGGDVIRTDSVASTYGGITQAQWRRILELPGVGVAAPVAMAGYVMQTAAITVDLQPYLDPGAQRQVLAVRPTFIGDGGRSQIADGPKYLYATTNTLEHIPGDPVVLGQVYDSSNMPKAPEIHEHGATGVTTVCEPMTASLDGVRPLDPRDRTEAHCWSTHDTTQPVLTVLFPIPLLLAAVDPEQEAKLDGLDGALVSGAYLKQQDGAKGIPVLASNRLDLDQQLRLAIERIDGDAAERTAAGMRLDNAADYYATQPAAALGDRSLTAQDVYPGLLDAIARTSPVAHYWTTGPMELKDGAAGAVPYNGSEWGQTVRSQPGANPLPMALAGDPVRAVVGHNATGEPASLRGVGVFDPDRVATGPALSRPPFDLYSRPAEPGASFAGPLTQRPHLITTLSALPALGHGSYTGLDGTGNAPISMVRVKLSGDVGPDAYSQERVRAVADQIHLATGLRVDLTVGSSPTSATVRLPGPPSVVQDSRLKLGVATTIVSAIDRKSLILAILVLIACALAVGNATSAAVRTRSTELGVLACLGWARWRLFALVAGESVVVGAVAGLLGTILALALSRALAVDLDAGFALLAVPAALLLSLLAALPPAWRATRADPGAAVRPAVALLRRRRIPRRVSGLALGNVVRAPGRTALGAASLAIGVAALTLLMIVNLTFRGSVSGTVLGDAITVQVQTTDYIAAVLTTLLGAATVADVLYVNIRERSAEFALLGAVGWADFALSRLAAYEALTLGVLGATAGAGAALGTAALLSTDLTAVSYTVAGAAAVAGTLLAATAAVLPVRSLRRLPTARLLAEE